MTLLSWECMSNFVFQLYEESITGTDKRMETENQKRRKPGSVANQITACLHFLIQITSSKISWMLSIGFWIKLCVCMYVYVCVCISLFSPQSSICSLFRFQNEWSVKLTTHFHPKSRLRVLGSVWCNFQVRAQLHSLFHIHAYPFNIFNLPPKVLVC